MFEELLDKSYVYYDGSSRTAAKMNESEKIEILNALSNFYEMSEFTSHQLDDLETILIILFNFSEDYIVDPCKFKSKKALKLFQEIHDEFFEKS